MLQRCDYYTRCKTLSYRYHDALSEPPQPQGAAGEKEERSALAAQEGSGYSQRESGVAAEGQRPGDRGHAEALEDRLRRRERGGRGVADEEGGEALALLVLRALPAVDEARSPALDDVAVLAHALDRRPHLHRPEAAAARVSRHGRRERTPRR